MNDGVLSLLERIAASHRRMAALAEALDWDGLVAEWRDIHPRIIELEGLPLDHLSERERAQAVKQMTGLIEFEKQISARIAPWMEQVRPMLETFRKYPLHVEGD
jgi:hypothetical protein